MVFVCFACLSQPADPAQWLPWAAGGGEMATASAGISATGSARRSKGIKTPSWFPCSQTSPPFKSTVFKDIVTVWEPPSCTVSFLFSPS